MTVLNFIFSVVGWAWLAIVVVAALVIRARRRRIEPQRTQRKGGAS